MENDNNSGWNLGVGLGLGALVGVLVSAIIGMLRLSKPKSEVKKTTSEKVPISSNNLGPQTSISEGKPLSTHVSSENEVPKDITTPVSSTSWSTGTKYFVSALLFLAFLGILYISSGSLSTIIFAALLTFIVHPIIKFFQQRLRMRRGGATVLTYLLVLGLLILIPFLIVPSIVEAIQFVANIDYANLFQNLGNWIESQAQSIASLPLVGKSLSSSLEELAKIIGGLGSDNPPPTTSIDVSFQNIGGRIAQTLEFLIKVFGPLVSIITTMVFTILISLHMSLSIDMIRDGIKKLIPPAYKNEIIALLRKLILIWKSFLRGQLSLMVIVGVIVWLGNELLGTPQALLLGVLAGLLEVIPSLGPILATIPAVILALFFGSSYLPVENWAFALIVIGFYVIVQIIENQLLVPYVLGDAVDLPPLIVIIGVVVGGSAFGLLGVFLATPVISSGREVFMYLYDKILEPPPEPVVEEQKPSMMETIRGFVARLPRPKFQRTLPEETTPAPEELP